jgi:hypothetical protein
VQERVREMGEGEWRMREGERVQETERESARKRGRDGTEKRVSWKREIRGQGGRESENLRKLTIVIWDLAISIKLTE